MRIGFGMDLAPPRVSAAAAAPTIASLYGTGLGQVPLHLDPTTAVMSGADVASVPNSGGAGAAFNATANTTGITRSGNRFVLPVDQTERFLQLANPVDAIGVRTFFVSQLDPALAASAVRFAGRNAAAAAGQRTELNITISGNTFAARRHDGTAVVTVGTSGTFTPDPGGVVRLYEIQLVGGNSIVAVNGVETSPGIYVAADLWIDRLFAGLSQPSFSGQAGDVVSLIVDGSGNQAAQIATIRNALAVKYGLTLA